MRMMVVLGYMLILLAVGCHLFLWRARMVDAYQRELWHKVVGMLDEDLDYWRMDAFHTISFKMMVFQFWRRPSAFHDERMLLHPSRWEGFSIIRVGDGSYLPWYGSAR